MNQIGKLKFRAMRVLLTLYTGGNYKNFKNLPLSPDTKSDVAIVISTFEKRFRTFALPLVDAIRCVSRVPITIVINGNFGITRDDDEYRNFLVKTQEYEGISIVTFNSFRGWSSLLNAGILHADARVSIVLNDDIFINPTKFKGEFEEIVGRARKFGILLLNNSWSHFVITRDCLETVGFFDEFFLGIGEEDGDYAARFRKRFKKNVPEYTVESLVNFIDDSRDTLVAPINGKYSLFNSVYLESRYEATKKPDLKISTPFEPGSLQSSYKWRNNLYPALAAQSAAEIKSMIEDNWYLQGQSENEGVE